MSLLAGIAASVRLPVAGVGVVVLAAGLLLLGSVLRRRSPRPARACLCLSLALGGLGLATHQRAARERALETLIGEGVDSAEMHFVGTVLSPPETDWNGDLWLRLRGTAERAGDGMREPVTVLLRVLAAGHAPSRGRDALETGDVVRVWCRLRRPGPPRLPTSRSRAPVPRPGLDAVGRVKSLRLVERLGGRDGLMAVGRVATVVQRRFEAVMGAGARERALVRAMLFGQRAGIDPDLRRHLRDAGMLHLVAISGLHVGILVALLFVVLSRSPLGPWPRFVLTAPLLAGFVQGVGGRPSVVRAAFGAGLLLLGRSLGREGEMVNTLAVLAAVLAAVEPAVVAQPGYQLTFLATAGIVALTEPIASVLPLPPALGKSVAVSTSAYLATAPVVALHFRWLAPVGLVSNLLAVPLCTVVLGAGYACILFADVPLVGRALAGASGLAARGLLEVANAAAAWEPGSLCVVPPCTGVVMAYYSTLTFYAGAGSRIARGATVPCVALLAVLIHLGPPVPAGSGRAEIDVVDVGQGQAVALRGPGGAVLLVDTGGSHDPRFDPGERIVLPHLVERGGGRLAALILTHGHVDHVGGAFAVLREIEVGQLWVGPGYHRDPRLSALARLAHERGTALVLAEAGSSHVVAGLRVQVLAPSRGIAHDAGNEASLVLLIGDPPARLLVPGDLEGAEERALVGLKASLRAEALVVAHHGSRNGTSHALLARVGPQWALISAGRRNPFGHPHAEVLERLDLHALPVLRTDELGSLRLVADRHGWRRAESVSRCRSARE